MEGANNPLLLKIMESIETLNSRLKDIFGSLLNGMARYRIVWSTEQTEKRFGKYEIVSPAGIYLRSESGVMEVPKYPLKEYRDQWILEKCFGNSSTEIVDAEYTYEPLWVFRNTKTGQSLYPNWKVCYIVCGTVEGFIKTEKMTPTDYMAKDDKEKTDEAALFEEMLGEDMRSPLFEDEAAVFMNAAKQPFRSF